MKITNTFVQKPLIFAPNFENITIMYLKYIRHKCPWGQLHRGTLYTVHFEPNEKGGYNEHLNIISDVYETKYGSLFGYAMHKLNGNYDENGDLINA